MMTKSALMYEIQLLDATLKTGITEASILCNRLMAPIHFYSVSYIVGASLAKKQPEGSQSAVFAGFYLS